jgi:glutamate racemase
MTPEATGGRESLGYPTDDVHLVITDSGLGGLAICAEIERALRQQPSPPGVRITYVNAWPEQGIGYNDLPDVPARARAFDRALNGICALRPDLILIACNTLSILYDRTAFRAGAGIPVEGILDAGIDLFDEALRAEPASALVLLGTRTTIESGVHRERLLQRGVAAGRVSGTSCHGLATAIERGPRSPAVAELVDTCTGRAAEMAPDGAPLYLGLCCTHYGMVAGPLADSLARRTGRPVRPLDPNGRLVRDVVPRLAGGLAGREPGGLTVEVISKVELDADQREAVAGLLETISPVTADALRACRRMPDLF